MVEHAPTGTPITDENLIRVARKAILGVVSQVIHHINVFEKVCGMIVMEPGGDISSKYPTPLTYMGVLDEEYSVYTGDWLGNVVVLVMNKNITPDTHDVTVDWEEIDHLYDERFNTTMIMGKAIAVIKRKEVMIW